MKYEINIFFFEVRKSKIIKIEYVNERMINVDIQESVIYKLISANFIIWKIRIYIYIYIYIYIESMIEFMKLISKKKL